MPAQAQAAAAPVPGGQLELVVILSRHGVRSPTWTQDRLNAYAAAPWPAWPAAPGELTPQGFELLKRFGSFDRKTLAARGLLAASGCADAASAYVYADTDQRTLASGKALAEGLFPGCAPQVHSLRPGENDPIFHARVKPDTAEQAAAVAEAEQRLKEGASGAGQQLLAALQRVLLGCPAQGACAPAHPPASLLSAEAWSVTPGQGDHLVDLKGGLPAASTLSEDLLLEYTDGMKAADVGWGRVDEPELRRLMGLHTLYFDVLHRTPTASRLENGGLLDHIAKTLRQTVEGRTVDGAFGAPGQKVVVVVGHDTNLAGIAALLGLHWTLDGRSDDTPPGTELAFELWQTAPGKFIVRTHVHLQTLAQMHGGGESGEPVGTAPPMSGCAEAQGGCSWSAFMQLAATPASPR